MSRNYAAVIFDMDGVIINSESVWETYEKPFARRLFGEKIHDELQSIVYGGSIQTIYEEARKAGFTMKESKYRTLYNKQAEKVYEQSEITEGVDDVMNYLLHTVIRIGLVTASPKHWVNIVMGKFRWRDMFDCIVSIDEKRLPPKPDPAGYLFACEQLKVLPQEVIVIEDSTTGIAAAKAAGVYTIGLRQHLPPGYISRGADTYINRIRDILPVLQKGTL